MPHARRFTPPSQPASMNDIQARFQKLLRDLFRFESADLDFGIYRIMNHKRRVIQHWMDETLPRIIEEAMAREALDPQARQALEAAVYNHLYAFFSRYYQDGDFISRRRYAKKARYAIPYNGEEVYLYWANHDQYFVKTAERFFDYAWQAPNGVAVRFELRAADVAQDNVKGDKRFFLPLPDAVVWEETPRALIIPFLYRPLTAEETARYGRTRQQARINQDALEAILQRVADHPEAAAALTAERRRDAQGRPVSYLAHHLRQYTARNARDYFIHKDLRGFLSRELDFYLKNDVLDLDELEAGGEALAPGWFQRMTLIKRIGRPIIDLLAQIEDFQKMLWEKKKFVTETFYLIAVGVIPADFHPEIAENEAQWRAWRALFSIAIPQGRQERLDFLAAHPTLTLDTRHFSQTFTDSLLAAFDDLDGMTDGLLIHGENWQALNLLEKQYRGRVKCVYIDPPYNTGKDGFPYKDGYRHASWMSMMADRTGPALLRLLRPDGLFFASISDHEIAALRKLLDASFGEENFIADILWNSTKTVTNTALISVSHTHNLVYARDIRHFIQHRSHFRLPDPLEGFANPDNDPRGPWKADPFQVGGVRPNQQYEIRNPKTGKVYRPNPGCSWKNDHKTFERLMAEGRIVFGKTGEGAPMRKRYLFEAQARGRVAKTWWDDVETTADGTKTLQALFGTAVFTNPKPVSLIKRIIQLGTHEPRQIVLDYFAGSGSTGHAVIELNREDGGRRRFILVEMGDHFDSALLPRIQKVIFAPEWKGGKPQRIASGEEVARGPRILKVIRLESYEDALDNITFDEESGRQARQRFGDEYLLRYALSWESRGSATRLHHVARLQTPFSYRLRIHRDGELREQPVDLPETFNYLIGLEVRKRETYDDAGRRYLVYRGETREGRRAAVIWRETAGWRREDYVRDREFVTAHIPLEDLDAIFVNGDAFIPQANALDALFDLWR